MDNSVPDVSDDDVIDVYCVMMMIVSLILLMASLMLLC